METEIHRFADAEAMAHAAADLLVQRLQFMVKYRGAFVLALAGGTTPKRLYERLASLDASTIPWDRVHFYWGDERCVGPDDPDSNYAMARAALLDPARVPEANVHRIRGELGPVAAAEDYEQRLRSHFGDVDFPSFDVVLLGMGEDGHTASLFPGDATLAETTRWAVPVEAAPKPPSGRVSLTRPVLSAAREAYVLVAGASKRPVLAEILADADAAAARYPAAAVRPKHFLHWFADDAALGPATP